MAKAEVSGCLVVGWRVIIQEECFLLQYVIARKHLDRRILNDVAVRVTDMHRNFQMTRFLDGSLQPLWKRLS
jgi:hypothetical protein